MGKYREIVANFAQKYGLKVYNDPKMNNTFILTGKYDLLQMYFNENGENFSCWGAILDDIDSQYSFNDFSEELEFVSNNLKMVYGLDKNYNEIWQKIIKKEENVENIALSKRGLKYFLEASYLQEPKFYLYKNKKIVAAPMPKRNYPLPLLLNLLKVKYPIKERLGSGCDFCKYEELVFQVDKIQFVISTSYWGDEVYFCYGNNNFHKFPLSQYSLQQIADEIIKIVNEHKKM